MRAIQTCYCVIVLLYYNRVRPVNTKKSLLCYVIFQVLLSVAYVLCLCCRVVTLLFVKFFFLYFLFICF